MIKDDNIEEYNKAMKILDEIVSFIKKYDLSPLEQVILAYDIVKSKFYNEESSNESPTVSRNLVKVLTGDKIVCMGLANLIYNILIKLDITAHTLNTNENHMRNYVQLKDEKYNIKGCFLLDVTYDSRQSKKYYLNNYNFFLRNIYFFESLKKDDYGVNILNLLKEDEETAVSIFNKKNITFFKSLTVESLIEFILEFQDPSSLRRQEDDESLEHYFRINFRIAKKYMNQKISKEAFKNALYKVRRIEFINNIIKKPYSEDDILDICDNYVMISKQQRLLNALFGREETSNIDLKSINSDSIEKDLLRMRLLRDLKDKTDDFPKNDIIKKM